MHDPVITQSSDTPVEAALRAELSRSDLTLAAISPVLRHLLTNDDHSLFSDEILSRVRGMIGSLARALLTAQGETSGRTDPNGIDEADHEALTVAMLAHDGLVGHCHALAVEWQITARLEAGHAVDPVLSPLLRALVASDDG